ncbi:MAG TPA: Fur family transcriptional regulator [Desulfotignum sp.]|nr:Fur family transcriptional regulator [Desulfotignum sp.]
MDRFTRLCKKNGLKITPQRAAVYAALKNSKAHPSADQIHKQLLHRFPNISLDTVNRTLITFARIQIIDIVEGQGDPRRFDPNREEHHHFYCLSCNNIFDFHDPDLDQIPLPEDITQTCTITGKRLCLTGYCKNCHPQTAQTPAPPK